MNFATRTRQLARVFVDAQGLSADPVQALQFAQEVQLASKISVAAVHPMMAFEPTAPGVPRVLLASPNLEWQLSLLGQSFDLSGEGIEFSGLDVGGLRDSAGMAAEILADAAAFFGRVP